MGRLEGNEDKAIIMKSDDNIGNSVGNPPGQSIARGRQNACP